MTLYHSADRIARDIAIEPGDDLDTLAGRWAGEYRRAAGRPPERAMVDAARVTLAERLEFASPPPLPASASSTSMRLIPPPLVIGLPGGRGSR